MTLLGAITFAGGTDGAVRIPGLLFFDGKALLILSDGNDNNSRFSESEIRSRVLEADVRIYALGIMHSPPLLQQLAEETGGKVLVAQDLTELPDIVQKLSAEIRSQYVLSLRRHLGFNCVHPGATVTSPQPNRLLRTSAFLERWGDPSGRRSVCRSRFTALMPHAPVSSRTRSIRSSDARQSLGAALQSLGVVNGLRLTAPS
jgi:hypothetical protein